MDAPKGIAPGSQVVVGFDLGGHRRSGEAQGAFDEGLAKGWPVDIRIRHSVGIELSGRATKLRSIHGPI